MEKMVMKLDGRSPEPDGSQVDKESSLPESVARFMRVLKKISGTLLGSIAVSTQIVNVLVCVFVIFVGPAFIFNLLSR